MARFWLYGWKVVTAIHLKKNFFAFCYKLTFCLCVKICSFTLNLVKCVGQTLKNEKHVFTVQPITILFLNVVHATFKKKDHFNVDINFSVYIFLCTISALLQVFFRLCSFLTPKNHSQNILNIRSSNVFQLRHTSVTANTLGVFVCCCSPFLLKSKSPDVISLIKYAYRTWRDKVSGKIIQCV